MCCPRHRRTLYRGAVRTYRNEAQFVESVTPEVNFEIEPMKEEDKQKFEQEFDAFLRSLDPHRHVGAAPKDTSPKGTQSVVASKDATDKVFKSKEQKKPTTTKSEHESPITGAAVTADKTFEQDSVSQRQTKSNLSNASIASKPSPTTTTYNGH